MTTPTLTSEQDAVNSMLATIGESPVNTIDGNVNSDVVIARNTLAEVNRLVQAEGWHFNTEENYPLPRNVDGKIPVPANTISVDADGEWDVDVVNRGGFLYDRRAHSFVFTRTLKGILTLLLPFEELPEPARQYIMVRAARVFSNRQEKDTIANGFTSLDEARARANLLSEEADSGDASIFGNDMVRFVARRGVPRRYS